MSYYTRCTSSACPSSAYTASSACPAGALLQLATKATFIVAFVVVEANPRQTVGDLLRLFFIAEDGCRSKSPTTVFRNEKIDINEINWTPNQHKEYHNLYIKSAKRAATDPWFSRKKIKMIFLAVGGAIFSDLKIRC